jgi:8-oxo-dGTP diphosphatase
MATSKQRRPGAAGGPSEADFLASYDATKFERLSVSVDVALLGAFEGALSTLLVKRAEHPHRGRWALPGGFVRPEESLDRAAARVLAENAGLGPVFLEQLYTFGDPGRDPRARVVAVSYYALVDHARLAAARSKDAHVVARVGVPWEGETGGPVELRGPDGALLSTAFDHADMVGMAVKRVRGKLGSSPVGFQVLPETFTLLDLQRVHETVLGRSVNKDSFRRRMLGTGQLEATGESERDVDHRPAELYRFVKRSAV